MSIVIRKSLNTIETPEIMFAQLDDEKILSYIPCWFYKGSPKNLVVVKKENDLTTFTISVSSWNIEIPFALQQEMDVTLQNGDKKIIDVSTGVVVINNGVFQVKSFEVYPFSLQTKSDSAPCLGFCYSDNNGEDKIGYSYLTNPDKIEELYSLSTLYRKKLMFADGDECTDFGISLTANLLSFPFEIKTDNIFFTAKIAKGFKPRGFELLEDITSFTSLLELGEKVYQKDEDKDTSIGTEIILHESALTSIRFPLSEILSQKVRISFFPAEVDIDLCLQPELKKIIWTGQKSFKLIFNDISKLSPDTMDIFENFDVEIKEVLQ